MNWEIFIVAFFGFLAGWTLGRLQEPKVNIKAPNGNVAKAARRMRIVKDRIPPPRGARQ